MKWTRRKAHPVGDSNLQPEAPSPRPDRTNITMGGRRNG